MTVVDHGQSFISISQIFRAPKSRGHTETYSIQLVDGVDTFVNFLLFFPHHFQK